MRSPLETPHWRYEQTLYQARPLWAVSQGKRGACCQQTASKLAPSSPLVLSISFAMLDPANDEYPRSKHGPDVGILLLIWVLQGSQWACLCGLQDRERGEWSTTPSGSLEMHQVWGWLGKTHDKMNRTPQSTVVPHHHHLLTSQHLFKQGH